MPRDVYIGPYQVLRRIGSGAQGSVFLGYDERLSRRVAVKIHNSPTERGARRELLREARAVARIQSPRVVPIHDIITSSEHLALVMEYVPGTDLEQVMSHTASSVASTVAVASDLAAGLAVTRQQGIVHGDLKPANVLVTMQGRIKLTDFGIACGRGEAAADRASHHALTPEHLRGGPLDVRSDLFSLGCLMYRMLSGRHPFEAGGKFVPDLMLGSGPQPLSQLLSPALALPEGLEELVHSLLRVNPRDRPGNTHQVRQALRAIDRQLPLVEGNALLRQSRHLFRDEPAPQRAPQVPADLRREGRSRLGPSATELRWSWQNPQARQRLLAVSIAAIVAVVALAGAVWERWLAMPPRVHLEAPQLRVAQGPALPGGFSTLWLVAEASAEIQRQAGDVHITAERGGEADAVAYAPGRSPAEQAPAERFTLALDCDGSFCLLDLRRFRDGVEYRAQGLLPRHADLSRWRGDLRRAVRALYREPGLRVGQVSQP